MNSRAIFILLTNLLSTFSYAVTLVAAPGSTASEFQVFAETHADLPRISQTEAENLPSPQEKTNLVDQFVHAKEKYFGEDKAESRKLFSAILSSSRDALWMHEMRAVFFDSALYLALMTPDKEEHKKMLREAVRWQADRVLWSEWPVDLHKEFEDEKLRVSKLDPTRFSFWQVSVSAAFLNGTSIDVKKDFRATLPEGKNQLVLIDDMHTPLSLEVDNSLTGSLPGLTHPIVTGTCDHPKVLENYDSVPLTVFFNKKCIWDKDYGGNWTRWKDNLSAPLVQDGNSSGYYNVMEKWPKPVEANDHFYQKPLFWAAVVGVLAIAVKIHGDQNNNKGPEPIRVAQP